jgi:hypothetical protein
VIRRERESERDGDRKGIERRERKGMKEKG